MLLYVYLGLAVLFAVCHTLASHAAVWLLPLYLLGGFLAGMVLHFIFISVCALLVDKEHPDEKRRAFYRRVMIETLDMFLRMGGVKITVEDREKLPEKGFLMVQNHLSGFDPLSGYVKFRDLPLSYISKIENLKIPIGGAFMAATGALALDRSSARQGITVIRTAAERIKAGEVFCVFPEGTRSRTGALGEFKPGCFKTVLWAKCPLAVMTVRGSEKVTKNLFRRRTQIVYTVKRVIPYEEMAALDTAQIAELAKEAMEA